MMKISTSIFFFRLKVLITINQKGPECLPPSLTRSPDCPHVFHATNESTGDYFGNIFHIGGDNTNFEIRVVHSLQLKETYTAIQVFQNGVFAAMAEITKNSELPSVGIAMLNFQANHFFFYGPQGLE